MDFGCTLVFMPLNSNSNSREPMSASTSLSKRMASRCPSPRSQAVLKIPWHLFVTGETSEGGERREGWPARGFRSLTAAGVSPTKPGLRTNLRTNRSKFDSAGYPATSVREKRFLLVIPLSCSLIGKY